MRYKEFTNKIKRSGVVETTRCYSHLIEKMENGKVEINGEPTKFNTIEEAREYVKQNYISQKLSNEVSTDIYEELSEEKIANIIKEHHNIKVTDTLIESYKELASSRMFTVDPIVLEIRSLNKLDRLVEGKLHYVLNDETIIAIDESTQDRLNNILQNHLDVVEYMRESKENFMHVLTKLEE